MKPWIRLALLPSCVLSLSLTALQSVHATPARKSALDGPLFYQLLLGELNVRQGAAGAGFSLLLDAARKTRDPALFQRAIDVALQSRSGEAALQAAQTWKREIKDAREPNRYILQILIALNRVEDAGVALATSLQELPDEEKREAIVSIPRIFARVSDKALAAQTVEKALATSLQSKPLQSSAWTTIGRMRRDAQQLPAAIDATLKAHASDPQAQGPIILALTLLPTGSGEIKGMLERAMRGNVPAELRLGYARSLVGLQASGEALQQLQLLTQQNPSFAPGWLLLGLLQLDNRQTEPARSSLLKHVELAGSGTDAEQQAGLTEAFMALSQIAQQQGQLEQATQWINRITAGSDPVRIAIRRAQLLEQQGRADEAGAVLSQAKPASPAQARQKALALSRWQRENRQTQQAHATLQQALTQSADDPDLLIELSLVLEKLKRYEEMEALLRSLMQSRPRDPHAYNALGYSLADRGIRLEEARVLIERAIELAPQDPYIQDSLGWLEFRVGRTQEALRILQAAYKAQPDAEIAAHLGEVLWTMGRRDEAAVIWREGLLLKSDNETLTETLKRLGFQP